MRDHRGLAYAHLQAGRFDDAIAEIKRTQALQEDRDPNALALLSYVYDMAGSHIEAQRVRKQLRPSPRPPGSAHQLLLHIGLGETDRAFALLEKAVERHKLLWSFIAADPRNDPLRSDPRFADLFRRVTCRTKPTSHLLARPLSARPPHAAPPPTPRRTPPTRTLSRTSHVCAPFAFSARRWSIAIYR